MVKEMEKNATGSRQQQATCIDERRDSREEALCWINAAVRAVGRREKNQHAADFFP